MIRLKFKKIEDTVFKNSAATQEKYGAPLVAAKSSTFFSLSPPLVCYSRLLTVAR
jgi:hypothetical protein